MNEKRNLAARAGRWSTQHRKKAIVGWLAFVVLAVFVGGSFGTKHAEATISPASGSRAVSTRHGQGISRRGLRVGSRSEQERNPQNDPAFRAAVDGRDAPRGRREGRAGHREPVREGNEGQLSPDGRSALVTFDLPGDRTKPRRWRPSLAAVSRPRSRTHAGLRIEEFGDASADKAISKAFEDDFKKAEITSLPITLIILVLAFGALLAAFVPLLLGDHRGGRGDRPDRADEPDLAGGRGDRLGRPADRPGRGVDYSMFYLRREREERAAGRSEEAALDAAAATSGRAVLVSGMTVITAMAGMYFGGAADVHLVRHGTIIVVAVAVLGSLTVLPAVLSKLGDRVNKGRVPFMKPGEAHGRGPRVGAGSSTAC